MSLGPDDEECSGFYGAATSILKHKEKLPNLRGLFVGEIEQEESEVSWIGQGDISQFLNAFPGLEDFRARGSEGFDASPTRHIGLKKLVIESGGLDCGLLDGVLQSVFPELEHLELWLGTSRYGWNGSAESVKPFLYENPFPKLKYLGLKNSDDQNEITEMAAAAPVLDQLEQLDLSLGVMRDESAKLLLESNAIKQLNKLDISTNYLSKEMQQQFSDSEINAIVADQKVPYESSYDGETHYYVSVGE